MDRCDRCFKTRSDGEHGVGLCPLQPRHLASAIITDDIPGGVTYENYGPHPVTFYSHTERRAYMEAHGLTQAERWCPTPGTDRDPAGIMPNGRYIDPQTMENATVLLSRVSGANADAAGEMLAGTFNISVEQDAQKMMEGDTKRTSRIGRRLKDARKSVDA